MILFFTQDPSSNLVNSLLEKYQDLKVEKNLSLESITKATLFNIQLILFQHPSVGRQMNFIRQLHLAAYQKKIPILFLIEDWESELPQILHLENLSDIDFFDIRLGTRLLLSRIRHFITLKSIFSNLDEQSSLFKTIVERTPLMAWTTTPDHQCSWFSRNWLHFTGKKMEEEIGFGWLEGVHPEDRENCFQNYRAALVARQTFRMEYRLRRHDGEYRWILDHGEPAYSDSGDFLGYVGSSIDIQEEKEAQLILKKTAESFQSLAELIPQIVWTANSDGKVEYYNRKWQEYTHLNQEDTRRQGLELSLHPDDLRLCLAQWKEAIQKGQIFESEYRLKRASDVSYRWHLVRAVPARDNHGQIIKWFGTFTDIDDQKIASEALKRTQEELERLVQERTRALTITNQELEAFCYSVSHDLRTPLRAVDGFSQALYEDFSEQLGPQGKHYLTRIRAGTQKLSQLIDDLLHLSRLTRTRLKSSEVSLSELAHGICHELIITNPNRVVEVEIEPDMVSWGDSGLIGILLENLFENSFKYTSKTPHAKIEFKKMKNETDTVFYIKDNGVGFDMTFSDRLFGSFERFHNEDEFSGIGIGLAIAQRVVHRHNGQIWANSELGQGATFFFTLKNSEDLNDQSKKTNSLGRGQSG